jgi:hypothetical protein
MEYQGKLGTGATVMVQDLIAATDNLWSETGPFRNPKTVSWLMACHPSAGFKIGVSIPAGYATYSASPYTTFVHNAAAFFLTSQARLEKQKNAKNAQE